MPKSGATDRLADLHRQLHQPALSRAPFTLRITRHSDVTPPVLVIKERFDSGEDGDRAAGLRERGRLHSEPLRRVLPLLRRIAGRARNADGIPFETDAFLTDAALQVQRTLALDEEAGAKLGIIFRLQERLTDLDRVELIARRVEAFSREEAGYWFSRMTHFGPVANRWAASGLRVMLSGPGKDGAAEVESMLEKLRART